WVSMARELRDYLSALRAEPSRRCRAMYTAKRLLIGRMAVVEHLLAKRVFGEPVWPRVPRRWAARYRAAPVLRPAGSLALGEAPVGPWRQICRAELQNENAMSGPLVDIVVPVHNGAPHLQECLDSVLAQTYQSWRLVVVNNASTDDTARLAELYATRDTRIRV